VRTPHDRRSIADRVQELQRCSPETEVPGRNGAEAHMPKRHEIVTSLRRRISRMQQRTAKPIIRPTPEPIAIEGIIEGVFEETPYGPVFTARSEFSTQMRRGRAGPFLDGIDRLVSPAMARLARQESLAGLNLAELVYFDTETTGLATASGTYVFLAGLGYVDGTIFVVEQLFMRDYSEEPSLLWLLGQRLARYPGVVTYNGRAFDIPLVQARYITNRVFDAPIPEQHLDMLPPARRLWKARGSGCRLTTLEQEVLGVEREGDVPGHLIPGIYFDAVHRSVLPPLRGVFYHNACSSSWETGQRPTDTGKRVSGGFGTHALRTKLCAAWPASSAVRVKGTKRSECSPRWPRKVGCSAPAPSSSWLNTLSTPSVSLVERMS
jgi:uncharacterized protein YprB with RNaseH-like and TPR domain